MNNKSVNIFYKGIYIGWRCPEFKHDCQRVNDSSKCFCGHLLSEHAKYTGMLANANVHFMDLHSRRMIGLRPNLNINTK